MSFGERTIKDEGLAFAITSKSIDHTKGYPHFATSVMGSAKGQCIGVGVLHE
jgi:hypothetical protein